MIFVDPGDVEAVVNHEGNDPMTAQGLVYMKRLIDSKTTGGFAVALVSFSPGARLNFHTHPEEQILYVTEGKGILATREEERIVTPGMVVVIPPGEVHWHGATEDSSFTHLALHKGAPTVIK
jgi:quercetin dioxygenase-like cupin family protein